MTDPITDMFHRTALLGVHENTQKTVEAALDAHAATGLTLVADGLLDDVCHQAALCTAVATAVRAFGQVIVIADGTRILSAGPYRAQTVAQMIECEGAGHVG